MSGTWGGEGGVARSSGPGAVGSGGGEGGRGGLPPLPVPVPGLVPVTVP